MANRPSILPRWADTVATNPLNVVQPPSGVMDVGWAGGNQPQAQYLNWLNNSVYNWLSYVDQVFEGQLLQNFAAPLSPAATSFGGLATTDSIGGFAYAGGVLCVAVNNVSGALLTVLWSADLGKTWHTTAVSVSAFSGGQWNGIVNLNGNFIVFGQSNAAGALIVWTSPDGKTWTDRSSAVSGAGGASSTPTCAFFGNGTYVLGGTANGIGGQASIWTSTTLTSWTLRTSTGITAGNNIKSGAYNGSRFVVVADSNAGSGTISSSADAATWAGATSANGATGSLSGFAQVIAVGSNFVYANDTGVSSQYVGTSPDGLAWTLQSTSTLGAVPTKLKTVNGVTFLVGAGGKAMTSTTGLAWTATTTGVATSLSTVEYVSKHGRYVLVGASGVILSSTDLVSWTARTWDTTLSTPTYQHVISPTGTNLLLGAGAPSVTVSKLLVSPILG